MGIEIHGKLDDEGGRGSDCRASNEAMMVVVSKVMLMVEVTVITVMNQS